MKERGIIFNAEMVRAIIDGRKTQTRRIMKVQPRQHDHSGYSATWRSEPPAYYNLHDEGGVEWACEFCGDGIGPDGRSVYRCPFGKVGDQLWVRETCRAVELDTGLDVVRYDADGLDIPVKAHPLDGGLWVDLYRYRGGKGLRVPSIHMPRWASRINLEITGVRVERLNDISDADARAEGIIDGGCLNCGEPEPCGCEHSAPCAVDAYAHLWQSIYGEESWFDNPWVWVIEFKRL
ncbi:hypothetical protein ACS25C_03845 [Dickeya undicola]|uniref:hypothetical protein n=1 Tax=Dickeya undicola TaxID=1577887 RepID=UPI003F2404CF